MPKGFKKDGSSSGKPFEKGNKIWTGRKHSEKSIEKMKTHTGENNSFFGKHHSEKSKKKISKNNCRYWLGKHRKHRIVSEITKDKIRKAMKDNKHGRGNLGKHWKLSESRKGKNHWNWKGGMISENKKIRNSIEYKLWRKSVFERDNFTCQKYGTKGGELHPHHINNFAEFPELQLAIDNGITLSKKAHREFHKKYGCRNNTKEQLEEFMI